MTPAEEVSLRLFSDELLFEEAIRFSADKELPAAQINGLLSFSRGEWNEMEKYVTHQATRNWPDLPGGREHPTKLFYREMKRKLLWLHEQALTLGFVPEGLTKAETRDRISKVAARLTQEFIQHLAAEMLYRQRG
jgi:hypothetical protein